MHKHIQIDTQYTGVILYKTIVNELHIEYIALNLHSNVKLTKYIT